MYGTVVDKVSRALESVEWWSTLVGPVFRCRALEKLVAEQPQETLEALMTLQRGGGFITGKHWAALRLFENKVEALQLDAVWSVLSDMSVPEKGVCDGLSCLFAQFPVPSGSGNVGRADVVCCALRVLSADAAEAREGIFGVLCKAYNFPGDEEPGLVRCVRVAMRRHGFEALELFRACVVMQLPLVDAAQLLAECGVWCDDATFTEMEWKAIVDDAGAPRALAPCFAARSERLCKCIYAMRMRPALLRPAFRPAFPRRLGG
jgi:hypothetical protein